MASAVDVSVGGAVADGAVTADTSASPGAGHGRGDATRRHSRFLLRNWRVTPRLVALIAIPTAAAIALGGVRVMAAVDSAANFQRIEKLAILGGDAAALAQAIEDERDITAGYIAAGRPASLLPKVRQQQTTTDQRTSAVNRLAAQIGPAYPAAARAALQTAINRLGDLTAMRSFALHSAASPAPVITDYSQVVADLLAFDEQIGQNSANATLTQTVRTLGALAQAADQATQQRAILYAGLIQGRLDPTDLNALTTAQADESSDLTAFQTSATLSQLNQFNDTVTGQVDDQANLLEATAVIAAGQGKPLSSSAVGGSPTTWYQAMSSQVQQMRRVESSLIGSIIAQSRTLQRDAAQSAVLTGSIVLVVLILVLLITIVIARSMVRPLRRLRQDALDIAERRLPAMVHRLSEAGTSGQSVQIEPIGVTSADEIGEVARSFDQVHREAVRLAADEAMLRGNLNAMFVNLSRRSQSLIERQLTLIDSLEQGEQEPSRLSSLFRLDHLATRMRRNSENLLVLAGHEVPRRWSEPVPLVDVLRAAISEIEQYERVALSVQPGVMVVGHAVNDVVHLVAELVENATAFSPGGTQVHVSGQPLTSGGVLLDVTDSGVGISEQELAEANWRLDNPPVVDVGVSRRMGLFVVGRLAVRHGIRVRLRHAASGGLTALVWLPDTVAVQESTSLGRLRSFGTVDYGPAPSLSAPPTSGGAASPPGMVPFPAGALPPTVGQHRAPVAPVPPAATNGRAAEQVQGPSGTGDPGAHAAAAARIPRLSPSASPQATTGSPSSGDEAGGTPADTRHPGDVGQPPNLSDWADRTDPTGFRSATAPNPSASGPMPALGGEPPSAGDVTIPAPSGQQPDGRLPIYDSLESDWFHRGRRNAGGQQPVASPGGAWQGASWNSPADEGWQAARRTAVPATGQLTAAGLPRRVPRANLVPGSVDASTEAAAEPTRSAEFARQRLASFQRGVRDARAVAPMREDGAAMTDEP